MEYWKKKKKKEMLVSLPGLGTKTSSNNSTVKKG